MAETLLQFGVEQLWHLLVREAERFQGVKEQFNGLKSELNTLRCFLEDADAKKHTSAMVRNTINDVREIVFDAEDIVETFLLKEELGNTSGIKKRVRSFSCVILERRGLAFDMEAISKRISKVSRDMQTLGVQQVISKEGYTQSIQERQRKMRQTFSYDNENNLVGLEENVKKLVGYLVEEGSSSSQVVSIIGMGGIGKTTLARQVFNHETIKSHFPRLAWVCVSQMFTRGDVWQTILRQLGPEYKVLKMKEDELQEKLVRVLETQKVLIVIDDIWREEDWDMIKPMFPRGKGWKILLTSRYEGVALRADPTCFTFKPDCLSLEESWTLFRRIAFANATENNVDEEMEEMGKQMIIHCGGLPLAVKLLGGLLAPQYTLREWTRVYENIKLHIVGGTSFDVKHITSVYHILYLSFEELPVYLKHCFLYLSHFPEDYKIDVEILSYYWAAEGISRPKDYERASIQEVGHIYIAELVKRSMIISERDDDTSRFKTCQLHDMMREVCLRKAEEEKFVQIVQGTSTANSKSPCKCRRLAVHGPDETFNVETEVKNPSLRTLLFIKSEKWKVTGLFFTKLKLMRVLDLSHAKFEGGKLPSCIGKLIHLRYLSLHYANVTHIPSSMRNLKQLLYLNLGVYCEVYMPNFLKEMRELTYLYLPLKIKNKVKMELVNLVNLETLENFSTEHGRVTDLQAMTWLRTLSIKIRGEGCNMKTLSSSLSELRCLENLTVRDYKNPTNNDDEQGFVLDCVRLKKLNLDIYMPRLPDEQHLPCHLTSISLSHCRLEEDPMPILEKLLQLKDVHLDRYSFCGKRMVCSRGGFPRLQQLLVKGLMELEEWNVDEGSMSLLRSLCIMGCINLKEVPDGLRFITSLMDMSCYMMGVEWKERLSEGGEDYYKVQHIPSVELYFMM